ncbi:hypothetical protein DASC09_042460 [Saccharomycopsis crataegensis]|uniref:CAIB/BAIF family enzyme n=1 Tax=Saccharomycopsis crataegensis TaxID=43959 RepID=A0AAV5QQV4_9ASCO|nr:hypothetical protein DASC09_042460 [Saccharomycopsis crataegensis]
MPYSLKAESQKIFDKLVSDPVLQFPPEIQSLAKEIEFISNTGIDTPIIPTSLKLTESSSAIWATVATWVNALIIDRYGADAKQTMKVDVDKATLNLVSVALITFGGKNFKDPEIYPRALIYDRGLTLTEDWRALTTNIYHTKDGKFFHLHGSMDSDRTLTMLGLPYHNKELSTRKEIIEYYDNEVRKYDSEWLDITSNERNRQAGAIVMTKEEFAKTEHGKAAADFPLYDLYSTNEDLPPVPWPAQTKGTYRPLEGINVLDVSRVIAAPQISKYLAMLGANVVRISNDGNPDMALLLFDTNLGKKDTTVNLKTEAGKRVLEKLIEDADVMVDGYRPNALARLGFSQAYIQFLAKRRGKGIVFVRENCYGYKGPWAHRSGWQQISDCITGVCWEHGKFLGLDEPAIPVFPNADYQCAFAGVSAVLNALWRRHKYGGSYNVDVSLTAYDVFLMNLGLLPDDVQDHLREEAGKDKDPNTSLMTIRHHDDMTILIPRAMYFFKKLHPGLFRKENFGVTTSKWHPDGTNKDEVFTYLKTPLEAQGVDFVPDLGSCPCGVYEPEW